MPIARRCLPALAAAALIGLPAGIAAANSAAPIEYPGRLAGPRFTAPSPLVVDEERLGFRCDDGANGPECTFEARYRVKNPTAEPHGGIAAFYAIRARGVVVRVDGRDARAPLSAADAAALDASVLEAEGERSLDQTHWAQDDAALQRTGFKLELAPGAGVLIVATGVMSAKRNISSGSYAFPALQVRHLLLHAGETETEGYSFDYLVSPIKTWAEVHRMEVSVRYPSSWNFDGWFLADHAPGRKAWAHRRESDFTVSTMATTGKDGPGAPGSMLRLMFTPPRIPIEHGGPFVGIGGVAGGGDAAGFRMRFGYEMAVPLWLIESVSVDADFRGRLIVTPALEAALPQIFFIPSLAVGVGVPVQVLPETRVGVRLLGSLQLFSVGFVTAVDIFPGAAPDDGKVQVSLMGRLSL